MNALVAPGNIQKPQFNFRPRVKGLWPCYSNKHMLLWNATLVRPSVYLGEFIQYTIWRRINQLFFGIKGSAEKAKVCNSVSAHWCWVVWFPCIFWIYHLKNNFYSIGCLFVSYLIQSYLFLLLFPMPEEKYSPKIFLRLMSKSMLSAFFHSFKYLYQVSSSIVSSITFNSFIHFEFIFVCAVRK